MCVCLFLSTYISVCVLPLTICNEQEYCRCVVYILFYDDFDIQFDLRNGYNSHLDKT